MNLQRQGAAQQRLPYQKQRQVRARVHLEVEQKRQKLERLVAEQLGFVQGEDGVLFFRLMEANDGLRDLVHQVGTAVGRFEVEAAGDEAQQVQGRARGPVDVDEFVQIGMESAEDGTDGGGLARADLAGDQADGAMIDDKLDAGPDLGPVA